MQTFTIGWNITSATLNWNEKTILHYNDGSTEESSEAKTSGLTFTVNESFTEAKHNTYTITFQDQTVEVDVIQSPRNKEVVSTDYEITDITLTNLKA